MADGTGRLTVRRSKTDQTSEGKVLYLSARSMARPGRDSSGRKRSTGMSPSSAYRAPRSGRRIARSCEVAGFPGAYSGHSPRVGMAQDLAANGAELPALMEAGRWESPTMPARYTRSQAAERGAVANYHRRPLSPALRTPVTQPPHSPGSGFPVAHRHLHGRPHFTVS